MSAMGSTAVEAAEAAKGGSRRSGSNSGLKGPVACRVESCANEIPENVVYYKRHRICPYHAGLHSMVIEGRSMRWCQQCARFETLRNFQGSRRSCRMQLEKHNARRRKLNLELDDTPSDSERGPAGPSSSSKAKRKRGGAAALTRQAAAAAGAGSSGAGRSASGDSPAVTSSLGDQPAQQAQRTQHAQQGRQRSVSASQEEGGCSSQDHQQQQEPPLLLQRRASSSSLANGPAGPAGLQIKAEPAAAPPHSPSPAALALGGQGRGALPAAEGSTTQRLVPGLLTTLPFPQRQQEQELGFGLGQQQGQGEHATWEAALAAGVEQFFAAAEFKDTGDVLDWIPNMEALPPLQPQQQLLRSQQALLGGWGPPAASLFGLQPLGLPQGLPPGSLPFHAAAPAAHPPPPGNDSGSLGSSHDCATRAPAAPQAGGGLWPLQPSPPPPQPLFYHHQQQQHLLLQHEEQGSSVAVAFPGAASAPEARGPGHSLGSETEVRLSMKLFNIHPDQLPQDLRQQVVSMVAANPAFVDSVVRPGCSHLTFDAGLDAWDKEELYRLGTAGVAHKLLQLGGWEDAAGRPCAGGQLWAADMLVQLGHQASIVKGGRLVMVSDVKDLMPQLLATRPAAVLAARASAAAGDAAGVGGGGASSDGVVMLWGQGGIAGEGATVICRQGGRALTLDVLDVGEAICGRQPPLECVVVRPLVARVGVLQFEVQRGGVLSRPLAVAALPSRDAVAEARTAQRELEAEGSPAAATFLPTLGRVLQQLLGEQGQPLQPASPPHPRILAAGLTQLALARQRGWSVLAELLCEALASAVPVLAAPTPAPADAPASPGGCSAGLRSGSTGAAALGPSCGSCKSADTPRGSTPCGSEGPSSSNDDSDEEGAHASAALGWRARLAGLGCSAADALARWVAQTPRTLGGSSASRRWGLAAKMPGSREGNEGEEPERLQWGLAQAPEAAPAAALGTPAGWQMAGVCALVASACVLLRAGVGVCF